MNIVLAKKPLHIISIVFLLMLTQVKTSVSGDTWATSNERWFERGGDIVSLGTCNYSNRYDVEANYTTPSLQTYVASTAGGACDTAAVYAYYCTDAGVKTWEVNLLSNTVKMVPGSLDFTSSPGRQCQAACPDGSKRDDQTGVCPVPLCTQEDYLNKAEDCGGEEFVQNWDTETCSGNCYCEETPVDDPSTNQYKALADFCGGPSRVEYFISQTCYGECKGCDEEYSDAVQDCAAQGWSVDRNSPQADECIYECAVEPCLDEFLQKEEDCGFWGIDNSTKNYDNCTASCAQACDDEYDELKTKCGIAGIAWFDNDTCSGGCKDCDWSRDECDSSCVSGFGKTDCSQRSSEGNIVSVNYGKCECLSPSEVMNTPEGGEGETYDGKEFLNGVPGSHGGTVVKNPDGSYTETLGNGTKYTYSADGKTVTASDGNGKTLSVSKDGNTTTYMGTNEFGEFTKITLEANPDGTITKKTEQGNDINFESPELGQNLIVTNSEEETVEGETTTAIDGTVINNPTYNEETEQPESTGPEITAQYQSSESYKWTDRVNYTAWNAAKDEWNTKSPSAIFNRTIEPYLQTFIKPGEVPQWSIAFPSVGVLPAFDIDIDLSPFNAVVPWFRFFIALGLVFVTFRNVPKLWSGES